MKNISYNLIFQYFLALANSKGEVITNLKIQKLLYYAQSWYLANFKEPLFEEDFQAWVHGPVISSLYTKLKSKGYYAGTPIRSRFSLENVENKLDEIDKNIKPFLEEIARVYFPFGAYQLELMTHKEDPWIITRGEMSPDEKCSSIIPKDLIQSYYGQKIQNTKS